MADPSRISDWLQILGTFGVVISLIFVGLQMRQAQQIALSEIYQSRADTITSMNITVTGSPELLAALSKVYRGQFAELTWPEAVALEHYLGASMTMFENNHRQHELGFLSEDHWERTLEELKCMLAPPLHRQMVLNWYYRESFRQILHDVVNEIDETSDRCWNVDWPLAERS